MIDYILFEKYSKDISVLFVEDDENIRNETQELLNDIFNNVQVAVDGKDGLTKYLNYYKEKNIYYDLVITDIKMPIMDGIELTKQIYKENKNQSLIILSAYNETKYLMELINLGITQFILKPIDIDKFINVIYKTTKELFLNKNEEEKEVNALITLNKNLYWNKELEQLICDNKVIKLTKKEFLLIKLLVSIPEKIFSNQEILDKVWNEEETNPDMNNLKNLISRLKRNVSNFNIENIYGFGYKFTTKV